MMEGLIADFDLAGCVVGSSSGGELQELQEYRWRSSGELQAQEQQR